MSKTIVVSGINLVNGGALSVYYDFLDSVVKSKNYETNNYIILVSRKELFKKYEGKMKIIEFPNSKKSWFLRIYYEYWYFNKLSKTIKPDVWLSMHDTTPNVKAQKRFVYCHNAIPFYKMPISKIKYGWKYYVFSKFYKYLYKINIRKNAAIIVQQQWMGRKLKEMFNVNDVIVARPSVKINNFERKKLSSNHIPYTFIYPSYPRVYKNFEVVCKAAELLKKQNINFKILITLSGNENLYSKTLLDKYKNNPYIKFIGLMERSKLLKLYSETDCLIFMSNLESWGLPISEYMATGKKIIVADLPYAYETIGNYSNVKFVDPSNEKALAEAMISAMKKTQFEYRASKKEEQLKSINNWNELINIILK